MGYVCERNRFVLQRNDFFDVFSVEHHYFVFSSCPQMSLVVQRKPPHLFANKLPVHHPQKVERLEVRLFIAEKIYASPVVAQPDVPETVLHEAACVGGRKPVLVACKRDVFEMRVFGARK